MHKHRHLITQKLKGQSAIVVALAMVALIAFVGLAIDGGSVYAQRRNAQNTSDAAAQAATRVMLNKYDAMIVANAYDVDGSYQDDQDINTVITQYTTQHGIPRSQVQAYYVNDNKQIIGSNEVGITGSVPWTLGAKGIVVKARGETDAFFMSLFNWNKVGAAATSTAFMGIAVDSGEGFPILPVGFFTDTVPAGGTASLNIGQTYTLIDGDSRYGSGNWGYVNFNGNGGSASTTAIWMACGFDPPILNRTDYANWATSRGCSYNGNPDTATGPTQHFDCSDATGSNGDGSCSQPNVASPLMVPYLKWGSTTDGWWLQGSTGTTNSNCQDLANLISATNGGEYMVPIFDNTTGGGTGTYFHLLAVGKFLLQGSVDCHVNDPGGTSHEHWHIQGVFESLYLPGATGRHGDLRHTSQHLVFLDN